MMFVINKATFLIFFVQVILMMYKNIDKMELETNGKIYLIENVYLEIKHNLIY